MSRGSRRLRAPLPVVAAMLGALSICLLAAAAVADASSRASVAPATTKAAGTAPLELYVGCSTASSAEPAHACTLGEQPGAFFESTGELEYEVCVTFPSTNALCPKPQVAKPGVLYVNPITTSQLGEHVVHWFVGGSEVASWAFMVEPAPVPPSEEPPVSQPPPPAEVEPAITKACGSARARVRRLQVEARRTTEPQQRQHLRTRLREARATSERVCA